MVSWEEEEQRGLEGWKQDLNLVGSVIICKGHISVLKVIVYTESQYK